MPAPNRCMFGGPIWGMETGRMTGHWADGEYGIWGQTRCLGIETKRQQAAALQTLRVCQRPLHPRQRVRYRWDQHVLPCVGVAEHISRPGVAEGPGGARAGAVARQATLVLATPGWAICGWSKNVLWTNNFRSETTAQLTPTGAWNTMSRRWPLHNDKSESQKPTPQQSRTRRRRNNRGQGPTLAVKMALWRGGVFRATSLPAGKKPRVGTEPFEIEVLNDQRTCDGSGSFS